MKLPALKNIVNGVPYENQVDIIHVAEPRHPVLIIIGKGYGPPTLVNRSFLQSLFGKDLYLLFFFLGCNMAIANNINAMIDFLSSLCSL